MEIVFDRIDNIVDGEGNACYCYFLLYPASSYALKGLCKGHQNSGLFIKPSPNNKF